MGLAYKPQLAVPMPVEAPLVIGVETEAEQDELLLEDKGISASISKTWTDQAIKCHLTSADCANCSVYRGQYSFKCQMDKVVPILLEVLGEPDTERVDKLRPYLHD